MYKIYINDNPFFITEPDNFLKLPDDYLVINDSATWAKEAKDAIRLLKKNEVPGVVLETDFAGKRFNEFAKNFVEITAAGGIVVNDKGEYLFIKRLGKWDLPKGKLDRGEDIADCALREVQEECGVENLVLGDFATTTLHCYPYKGKMALKITYWYEMTAPNQPLIPQTEEDITEAKWCSRGDIDEILKNTYPNISDIINDLII